MTKKMTAEKKYVYHLQVTLWCLHFQSLVTVGDLINYMV